MRKKFIPAITKLFWILFFVIFVNVSFLAINDIIQGFNNNYPAGYTYGKYPERKSALILSCIFALYGFFILIFQNKLINRFGILNDKVIQKSLPYLLFFISIVVRLIAVYATGMNTQYGSDVKNAIDICLEDKFPIESAVFSIGSAWAIWPIYLKIIYHLFGTIIFPGILLNTIWGGLSVVLLYLVVLEKTKDIKWALISAEIFMFWPIHVFWTISLRPEHICIALYLLCLFLFIKAQKCSSPKISSLLICLSAISLALSSFFKRIDQIIIIAAIISFNLFFINKLLLPNMSRQNVNIKSYLFKFALFGIIYLLIIELGFYCLDHLYVHGINRKISAHYLEIGLSPWSDGTMHGLKDPTKPFNVTGYYVNKNNYNYDVAAREVLDFLKSEIQEEKNLTFKFFYNKLRISWANQAYYNWVEGESGKNNLVNREYIYEYLYPISQISYTVLLLLITYHSLYYVINPQKETNFFSFFCALVILGFLILLLIIETQPRYKCVVYPLMSILAAKGSLLVRLPHQKLKIKFK